MDNLSGCPAELQKNGAFKSIEDLRERRVCVRSTSGIVRRRSLVRSRLDAVRLIARRDASAPSGGRHAVDTREHARHMALIAESGRVRCLCK